ncbi:MAG: hypothetical protein ACK57J_19225, partial [Rubrivivax sp.]
RVQARGRGAARVGAAMRGASACGGPVGPCWGGGLRWVCAASRVAVDYVTIDLSDAALRRNEAQAAALKQLLTSTVLMKAASHLPQEPSFSLVAGWTAQRAPAVVQDETGLSVQDLRAHFNLRYYGQFTQAHTLWQGKASAQALKTDVAASEVEPLLFTFGYEKPAGSLVVVGRRLGGGAGPATPSLAVHQR